MHILVDDVRKDGEKNTLIGSFGFSLFTINWAGLMFWSQLIPFFPSPHVHLCLVGTEVSQEPEPPQSVSVKQINWVEPFVGNIAKDFCAATACWDVQMITQQH